MSASRSHATDGAAVVATVKRALIGPPIPTRRLSHTLLPKVLALPVFSSDALSSVAYATEQILIVLVAANAAAAHLAVPITLAVSALMAVVVVSYRQTVRGYPHGGGAYIVARRNLGTIPGLVAAAALLTDYVLTVTVSVAAGAFAVTSAVPAAGSLRMELSLAFVVLMAVANLRGLRESGLIFAVPTYAFIASILIMVGVGLVRCFGGCPTATVPSPIAPGAGAVGLFVLLHAFSSGSTALTGVEAISNGVPAFRPPSARNAEAVLATMGAAAIAMFLGISWLAVHTEARPSHDVSVVAQTAEAVFGRGFGFYAVQVTTAAILVVAANTAFQDFPRLASILARDRFVPQPFRNRGDRLVFSNGILTLALLAAGLIVAYDADVSRLIQLYVVGVFIAFTLSQSGMVVHWWRSRDPARRRSMIINAIGAAVTGLVLVVITMTKFTEGAWIVVVAIPLFVTLFLRNRRRILDVRRRLALGTVDPRATEGNRCVLVVRDVGQVDVGWRYLRILRADRFDAVDLGDPGHQGAALTSGLGSDQFLTIAVAGLHRERRRWLGMSEIARMPRTLAGDARVVFAQIPTVSGPPDPVPDRIAALVLAADASDPEARALSYARSVGATELHAVHVALDPEGEQEDIANEWTRRGFDPPLHVVDAPLRHLGPPVVAEVQRLTARAEALVMVIVPIVIGTHPRWPWRDRQARYVEGLFLHSPGVMVCEVPFALPNA